MSVMRKLEPIYELIDAGNNKGALQAIDRDLLRKYPALQIGRVLKGIVLGRLGRFDEGRELCESVRAEGPSDDTVLNTLALYYRQNDMRAELIGAFESASERQPRNVEYLKTLFSAYARDYVHVKQQQCAMKLYRLTNDPKHITWAVCAMLVQSRDVPSLIRVAAAACAKLRDAGAVRDRETLLVCARVFREAGDIDASLALLDGPIGDACLPMLAERASLRAATASPPGIRTSPPRDGARYSPSPRTIGRRCAPRWTSPSPGRARGTEARRRPSRGARGRAPGRTPSTRGRGRGGWGGRRGWRLPSLPSLASLVAVLPSRRLGRWRVGARASRGGGRGGRRARRRSWTVPARRRGGVARVRGEGERTRRRGSRGGGRGEKPRGSRGGGRGAAPFAPRRTGTGIERVARGRRARVLARVRRVDQLRA